MTRLLHSLSTLRAAITDDDARLASGGWLILTGLGVVTGYDQRSLVTLIPQLELVAALDAIAKTRPTSGSLVRPAGLTWG